jgi:hypothetical protein
VIANRIQVAISHRGGINLMLMRKLHSETSATKRFLDGMICSGCSAHQMTTNAINYLRLQLNFHIIPVSNESEETDLLIDNGLEEVMR